MAYGGRTFLSSLTMILTHKTTLVPAEIFRPEEATLCLEFCGLRCEASECVVWSEPREGVVAVMAADRSVVEQYPKGTPYRTPLLEGPVAPTEPTVWLAGYGNLLYIKVYDPTLRLAEVLHLESEEDILYYVATLGEMIPTRKYRLQTAGEDPAVLKRLLKSQFK